MEEDQEHKKQLAAWCSQGHTSHCTRGLDTGQRQMIVKDGERNGPLSTARSDDDDEFQVDGPATAKHRRLNLFSQTIGTINFR